MVKNYSLFILFIFSGLYGSLHAQEIKIFKTTDFDLKGKVKSCLVRTNYGKEEYDFNEDGFLTKSVTRYSDQDYNITYYKYVNGELIEKRLENYRDNSFDESTSIANFYTIDTIANRKITEKIISYTKEFLDQYKYQYNEENRLSKIVRTNNNGIDETIVTYTTFKDENTKTLTLNDVILESVRTSQRKAKNKSKQRVLLTKKFLNGEPNTALEEIYGVNEKLISKTKFFYDSKSKQFTPEEIKTYTYDKKGMRSKVIIQSGAVSEVKEYIYQFDNGEEGNWVKEIITPDNTYKTREIKYYEPAVKPSEGEGGL